MLRGRGGRIAITLLCPALAVVLVYLGWDAVHPATSAPEAAPALQQMRKPAHSVRTAPTSSHAPARKPAHVAHPARARHRVRKAVAARRAVTYRIAFFGDSVSVGAGASDRGHAYVAHVSGWLRTHRKRVVETVHARGGVPVAYWEYARMSKHLDAAVVELGTNDVRLGTSPARFEQEYRTLTRRILAANRRAQVLCLSVWSHPGGASLDGVVNARIRAACPGAYVDITGLRYRPHIRSSDGFHPNDSGYRLIARAVESRLKTR